MATATLDYGDQASSIFEGYYTRGIARELQAWLAKVPPLKPLFS